MGCHAPLMCCCNTAPTAVSEASVIRHVGASSLGYERRVAFARVSLVALKAARVSSVQGLGCGREQCMEWMHQ